MFDRRPTASGRAGRAVVGAALTVASAAGCATTTGGPPATRPSVRAEATVAHVVDGDTVDLDFGGRAERVRLLGIDTPETVKPNTPVQCFGPEASARTKALLPVGTGVRVERDAEARDRYGRLLLYLYRRTDRLFVNRSLLADGYARVLSISPNTTHAPDLAAASASAERANRGLWARCSRAGR